MKHYTPMYDEGMCCCEDAGVIPPADEVYYKASEVDALLLEVLEVKASYGIPDTATRVYKRIANQLGVKGR